MKQKKNKSILSKIRLDLKYRRNIDIERFLELRETSEEGDIDEEKETEQIQISQEHLAFGIEILSDGTKRFKNYDKVLLSGENPFEVALVAPEHRTANENLYLAHYLLQNVKFFSIMNLTLIAFISRKLTAKLFYINDNIITKREIGD